MQERLPRREEHEVLLFPRSAWEYRIDAPASRNLCGSWCFFVAKPVFRNAGALQTAFPRRSVGTITQAGRSMLPRPA